MLRRKPTLLPHRLSSSTARTVPFRCQPRCPVYSPAPSRPLWSRAPVTAAAVALALAKGPRLGGPGRALVSRASLNPSSGTASSRDPNYLRGVVGLSREVYGRGLRKRPPPAASGPCSGRLSQSRFDRDPRVIESLKNHTKKQRLSSFDSITARKPFSFGPPGYYRASTRCFSFSGASRPARQPVVGTIMASREEHKNTLAAAVPPPVIRTSSPGPLAADFARQQVIKQQKSNFHSSSLKRTLSNQTPSMVSNTVNRTALHPHGLQYVSIASNVQLLPDL